MEVGTVAPAAENRSVMQQEQPPIEFLEPWWSTAEKDALFHEPFHQQLRTEVGPGHVMYGVPARMIARHVGSDDTLFELLDGSGRVAVVHLTWAKAQERLPWPGTDVYPSLKAFVAERMMPEHQEYLAS